MQNPGALLGIAGVGVIVTVLGRENLTFVGIGTGMVIGATAVYLRDRMRG